MLTSEVSPLTLEEPNPEIYVYDVLLVLYNVPSFLTMISAICGR